MEKTRKIALLGGTETWKQAPFDDPEWEIWCLGNQLSLHQSYYQKIDLLFEIHNDLVDQ